jgi:L-alanine-DL-glutamate epimerase-like enolase superfamily enzyme
LEPHKILRVDANCGWSVDEAVEKAKFMADLGVEFIEQPIPAGNNAALKKIRAASPVPIMADESSCTLDQIADLAGCVDGINIKLVKCGGLREALKMIHVARALDMKVMLGCMIESSVLISAAAQLAPLADYADLDGNLLIADDPFRGVRLDSAKRLLLSDAPGIGVVRA